MKCSGWTKTGHFQFIVNCTVTVTLGSNSGHQPQPTLRWVQFRTAARVGFWHQPSDKCAMDWENLDILHIILYSQWLIMQWGYPPWYSQISILIIVSSYYDDVNGTVLVAAAEGSLRVEVDNQSFEGALTLQYTIYKLCKRSTQSCKHASK